jgi:hypothetical protein
MNLHNLCRHNIYVDTWLEVSLSATKRKKKWKFGCSCFYTVWILHFHEVPFNSLYRLIGQISCTPNFCAVSMQQGNICSSEWLHQEMVHDYTCTWEQNFASHLLSTSETWPGALQETNSMWLPAAQKNGYSPCIIAYSVQVHRSNSVETITVYTVLTLWFWTLKAAYDSRSTTLKTRVVPMERG